MTNDNVKDIAEQLPEFIDYCRQCHPLSYEAAVALLQKLIDVANDVNDFDLAPDGAIRILVQIGRDINK